MDTIETLERVFLATPEDDTLAAALSDAWQEERRYNVNEVARRLDELRGRAHEAAALACAARHLSAGSVYRPYIHARLRAAALLPLGAPLLAVLVEGEGRSWSPKSPLLETGRRRRRTVFTVGHLYVLRWVISFGRDSDREEAQMHLRRAR